MYLDEYILPMAEASFMPASLASTGNPRRTTAKWFGLSSHR
jgi:hypothetical protein